MAVRREPRLFTVEEYDRMVEAGILGEDDRVELIEGEIVKMTAIGSRHAACVNRLTEAFVTGAGEQAIVLVQNPVRVSDLSQPQPDLALVRRKPSFYAEGHPRPEDVFLVVEVADTSVDDDRTTKASMYAATGVPELWIADLPGHRLDVYRSPAETGYRQVSSLGPAERTSPLWVPSISVLVGDVLG